MSGRLGLRILVLSLLATLLGSCKPVSSTDGEVQIKTSGTDYVLIDAKAQSCKSRNSATPTDDIEALYFDLGKFSVSWTPPQADALLKIIYIKIFPKSSGITNRDPITIAGQDLNCIFSNDIDNEPILDAVTTTYTFNQGLALGGLSPVDATKRSRFSGRADVLIYALVQVPGQQDRPVTGRTTFEFEFTGIF